MRCISTVTVLLLVLLFAVPGDVYSLNHPYGYTDTEKPDGDDHPWGGDEQSGDPVAPDDGKSGYDYLFSTGTTTYDYSFIGLETFYITIKSWFFEKEVPHRQIYKEREVRKSRTVTAKFFNERR